MKSYERKVLGYTTIMLMTLAMVAAMLPTVNAQATLAIVPQSNTFYTTTTPINSTFTVNATGYDIIDLYTWQITIDFDPAVLECVSATLPTDHVFAGLTFFVSPAVIDDIAGTVLYGATLLGGESGVNVSEGTLAQFTFKMISAPPNIGSVSSGIDFYYPGADAAAETFMQDYPGAYIPFTAENGYYEYIWPSPTTLPYLEVRPSLVQGSALGTPVDVEVWVRNLNASWEVVGVQFAMPYNTTLVEFAGFVNGSFMESAANGGETVFSVAQGDIEEYGTQGIIKAVVGSVFILPDFVSGNWIAPFPSGDGLLMTVRFNPVYETMYDDEEFMPLELRDVTIDAFDNKIDGALFVNWADIQVDHDPSVSGMYRAPQQVSLTITATTGGTTSPAPGEYIYHSGDIVSVTAIPDADYRLDYWELDDSDVGSANPYDVNMDANHTLNAVFIDNVPPQIGTPTQNPPADNVQPDQPVKVSVSVTDSISGVKNVTLSYTTNDWATGNDVTMTFNASSGLWEGTIPGQAADTLVKYKITAYDNAENMAENNNAGMYYVYQVIFEFTTIAMLMILMLATLIVAIVTRKLKEPGKASFWILKK